MLFSRVTPCVLLLLATACSTDSEDSSTMADAGETLTEVTASDETMDSETTESSSDESSTETASSGETASSDETVTEPTETETDHHDAGLPDPHAIPEDASTGALQCATLASVCHRFDVGTGDQGDVCHDIGHEGEETECAENYDECVAYCGSDAGHEEPVGDGGHEHEEDAGHEEPAGDAGVTQCQTLGELCHDLDTGDGGLAHECHEVGHDDDPAACAAIYDECVALCSPADAG